MKAIFPDCRFPDDCQCAHRGYEHEHTNCVVPRVEAALEMITMAQRRRLPHPSITEDRVTEMVMRQHTTLDNPGICLACGEDADGCEPDAENYECEHCGESTVMGAEQILLARAYHPSKEEKS